jgi:hypothetical protein
MKDAEADDWTERRQAGSLNQVLIEQRRKPDPKEHPKDPGSHKQCSLSFWASIA